MGCNEIRRVKKDFSLVRKKEILMIGPHFDCQGGISAVSKMLYDYLNAESYSVYHLGSTIEGTSSKRLLYCIASYIKFLKIFISRRYPIVHVHLSTGRSFYRKMYYIILSQMARRKVVLHLHPGRFFDFYQSRKRFFKSIMRKILEQSEVLIVLFEAIKKKFSEILPEEKIFVLNNPVLSSHFRCQEEKKKKTILYLGWIIPEKGVYDILKAMPGVIEQDPSVRFVFCGTKEVEKLRSLCKQSPYRDHVSVKGWVEGDEKIGLLSQSAMLLLPSYTEGFPNVILEAMSSCLPIITTPVGAIPEILQDGINCFYIQPGDIRSLEEKILLLLKDSEIGTRMGEANLKLVQEKYEIKIIGKRLEEIYSQINI